MARAKSWRTLLVVFLYAFPDMTVSPSGLRRWLQAPVRKGVGSNPTAVAMPTTTTALPFACEAGHPRLLKRAMHLFIHLNP